MSPVALQIVFAIAIVILTAYLAGRVHQWYRHSFERETAYREGYDQASHSLFHLAIRNLPAHRPPARTLDDLEETTTRLHRVDAR